jgi:predicted GIY-YIG superfamily endonuclease
MVYICYLITNGKRTYVGISNNFGRRLRQHNGEISGGARSTSRRAIEGQPWRFAACVRNIAEKNDALSYEKCVHLASKPGYGCANKKEWRGKVCGVENRKKIMQDILIKYKQGQYINKTTGQVRDASEWEFTLEDPLAGRLTSADDSDIPCSPDPLISSQPQASLSDADGQFECPAAIAFPLSAQLGQQAACIDFSPLPSPPPSFYFASQPSSPFLPSLASLLQGTPGE